MALLGCYQVFVRALLVELDVLRIVLYESELQSVGKVENIIDISRTCLHEPEMCHTVKQRALRNTGLRCGAGALLCQGPISLILAQLLQDVTQRKIIYQSITMVNYYGKSGAFSGLGRGCSSTSKAFLKRQI